jgi:hypothetical protein
MQIDLNRLHARKVLRNAGKTFEMLVKVLQNSDFTGGNIVIVGFCEAYALDLLDEFIRIGLVMKYTLRRITYNTVRVQAIMYKFVGAQTANRICIGSGSLVFRDHYQGGGKRDVPRI